jgi:hypothetical protein
MISVSWYALVGILNTKLNAISALGLVKHARPMINVQLVTPQYQYSLMVNVYQAQPVHLEQTRTVKTNV